MTNAKEATIVDGVLKEVGDRLFYDPVRPIKSKFNVKDQFNPEKPKPVSILRTQPKPLRTRTVLSKTLRKVPEVMVKVSGGGKSLMQIKAHLDYISRNGEVPIENENGDLITGKEAVRDLRDEWQYGRMGMTQESNIKQSFNIVLSMPPGTDRKGVTDAARDFAKAEFGDNYSYVFATHDDEKHPHVHLCVKALGKDGVRLHPRKPDLQRWREIFADKLKDHGIEANATKRQVRGVPFKRKKQTVLHIENRENTSYNKAGQQKDAVAMVKNNEARPNPYGDKINRSRQLVNERFNGVSDVLSRSSSSEDREMAAAIQKHVKSMKPAKSVRDVIVDEMKTQIEVAQQKSKTKDKDKK